jgi:hypothetical protein
MNKGFAYLIKLIISIAVLVFASKYYYWFLNLIGIKTNGLSNLTLDLLNVLLYFIIFLAIYIIYKEEIRSGFNRFRHKFASNILYCLMAFVITLILVIITNYLCKALANSFHLSYYGISYLNIFNKTLDLNLIIIFIKSAILLPIIYVAVFVLGVNNLCDGNIGIILSGLLFAAFIAYIDKYTGIGNIIINVMPRFILFCILAYIYRKNNNIAFSIVTYILFMLLAGLLVTKFV